MDRYIKDIVIDGKTISHTVILMPPDGSCLFHSISYRLYGENFFKYTQKVRKEIVNHVVTNWQDLQCMTCNENGSNYDSIEQYREAMLKPHTYGSLSEIKAASILYNLRMQVYQSDDMKCIVDFNSEKSQIAVLRFSGNFRSGHFDICIPIVASERSNEEDSQNIQQIGDDIFENGMDRYRKDLVIEGKNIPHTVICMPPDENSLFNSVSYTLYGENFLQYTEKVREAIVNYVIDNWQDFQNKTCNENDSTYDSIEQYREAMVKPHTYGSLWEIQAAGILYNLRMQVYQSIDMKCIVDINKEKSQIARLCCFGIGVSGHYDVCIPITTPESLNVEESENIQQPGDGIIENVRETTKIGSEKPRKKKPGRPKKTKPGRPKVSDKTREEQLCDAIKRYKQKNPNVQMKAVSMYGKKNPQIRTKLNKEYQLRKNLEFSGNIENITARLTLVIGDRLEAEKNIKWVLQNRKSLIGNYLKSYESLKKIMVTGLEKYRILLNDCHDILTKFQALLGKSLHCPTQEPYFTETSYKLLEHGSVAVMNNNGRGVLHDSQENIRNKRRGESWTCDIKICLLTENMVTNLERKFIELSECPPKTIYKFMLCEEEAFKNNLRFFNSLKSHFPSIRTMIRQLYEMKSYVYKIYELDNALEDVNIDKLNELWNPANIIMNKGHDVYNVDCDLSDSNLNEDQIIEKYHTSLTDMKEKCLDTPKNECLSCQGLFCLRNLTSLSAIRKPLESNYWKRLQQFIEDKKVKLSNFICTTCLLNFRSNKLPTKCILNGLYNAEVPDEIRKLNEYEKILIQRAKAFQVITSMVPVSKKRIPHRHAIKKVKGRTFHLPLPLEATLKKIPRPEEPLNTDHELYILVRGHPTKSKIIWQDLVNLENIYNALKFFKYNNKHYSGIVLPENFRQLQHHIDSDIQFEIETVDQTNQNIDGALLTQVTEKNQHEYEQYTIYPLHERRQNKSAASVYQMLKVNAPPLDIRDKDIDVKCFPDLYVDGKYGQFYPREKKITSAEFIKSKLMSCHAQYRRNHQYLFYLLNDANMRQLSAGIFYMMNITKQNEKLTKKTYLEMMEREELEGDLTAIFSHLRNTEQYWRKPRNEVLCMTRYYGPATWFLTVSPSEWNWTDLGQYIKDINGPDMAKKSISEIIAQDPVAVSRFIDLKFKALLGFLCSKDEPLGKVEHYFWRREYQSRGLQHFHCMLWIKDAPILEQSTVQEVANFISKYVTCVIPNKQNSPQLHDRVMNYQLHKHNNYCLRNKKKSTGYIRVCRFGFPRPVTDQMKIIGVTESVAAKKTLSNKRLYNIPRTKESVYINDYNPVVLLVWNGNVDIQFIGEKTTILNYYITKYTTKGEKSHVTEMFEIINSTKTLTSRLFNVGLRALNNRECGLLEASDTLLGLSLYGTDPETIFRWLDVKIHRNRRVKSKKDINNLHPNSSDLFYKSLIDDYYPNRPAELEEMNLYDFARWYDIVNSRPVYSNDECYQIGDEKFLKRRKRPYLINHYPLDIKKYPEQYYFAILLLFMHWRNLVELKKGQDSYTEAFNIVKETINDGVNYGQLQNDYKENLEKAFEMIEEKIAEIQENRQNDANEHDDDAIENPIEFEPVQAINAMDDFRLIINISDQEMKEMIDNLNSDQKRIFDKIHETLDKNSSTLRLFVSGTGGTGKSYLINTIKQWVSKKFNKTVAVTAPTGIAAFNVNGLTVHRLLQLPVEHGLTPKYKPLSDQVLKVLRADLSNMMLIIIDEVSMISNITLMYIHLRLMEIFDTSDNENGWFGGKHILVFGDLLQLPPVREQSPFEDISAKDINKLIGSLSVITNLWKKLFSYEELCINMRQKNDNDFMNLLSRLRLGVITIEDSKLLSSRLLKFNSTSVNDRLQELTVHLSSLPESTVCLLPTRNMCAQLNEAMLKRIEQPVIEVIAIDEVECRKSFSKKVREILDKYEDDSSMTAGLERRINIKIGARVMLRRIVDLSLGLVNGSIGNVEQIFWDIDDINKIKKIRIKFTHGLVHDLEPVKNKFEVFYHAFVYREQFPICLAYAITIHKSQGLSLDSALLDIGSCIFSCGQAYVALSRVKNLTGVHLINFDPSQLQSQKSAIIEYNRLRTLYRPDLSKLPFKKSHLQDVTDRVWSKHPHTTAAQKIVESIMDKKNPSKRKQPTSKKTSKKKKKFDCSN